MATLINDTDTSAEYAATAGQTTFAYTWWAYRAEDLAVYVNGAIKTLTTDYTVSQVQVTTGGNVVFTSGLIEGDEVVIFLNPAIQRQTNFQTSGSITADALNLELAYLVSLCQYLKDQTDRAFKFAPGAALGSITTEVDFDSLKGKVLGFNSTTGQPQAVEPTFAGMASTDELNVTSGVINIETAASPVVNFYNTDAAADEKRFRIFTTNALIVFQTRDDADSAGNSFMIASRTGTTVDEVEINATLIDINGNVDISGSLAKGSGSFKIDHPLKPDTHHLLHSFVEAPQADLIYSGMVDLVAGTAVIDIDLAIGMSAGTFDALCRDARVFTSNESGWDAVKGTLTAGVLTIQCQNISSTDTISWMVVATRKDTHIMQTDWTDENGYVILEPEK